MDQQEWQFFHELGWQYEIYIRGQTDGPEVPALSPEAFKWLKRLKKIARELHHLDEEYCNRELHQSEWQRRRRLEREAAEIAARFPNYNGTGTLKAYHQSDPRGCALYLIGDWPDREADYHYSNGLAITTR